MDTTQLPILSLQSFGHVYTSAGFEERFGRLTPLLASELFKLFANNDWGTICEEDKEANARGLLSGIPCRLMGSYEVGPRKEAVWVISYVNHDPQAQLDPDICNTCVLLPSDY